MLKKLLREKKGSVAVVTALAVTALMLMAALVVDAGVLYLNRIELSNMADAAVLAGAQDLPDSGAARDTVATYAQRNGRTGDRIDTLLTNSNTTLTLNAMRNVVLFFSRIADILSADIHATAEATIMPISGASGVVPWGVEQQSFTFGTTYQLKAGAGGGYNGNYGALALGGSGANTYRDNIKYGYNGKLSVGDWVSTEPGNMSGPTSQGVGDRISQDPSATFQTVQENSPRIVIVPVISELGGNGRHDVQIVGFAAFFLEGVGGQGNNNYVTGKFRKMVVSGDVSSSVTNFGLYGTRLIR